MPLRNGHPLDDKSLDDQKIDVSREFISFSCALDNELDWSARLYACSRMYVKPPGHAATVHNIALANQCYNIEWFPTPTKSISSLETYDSF